MRPVLHDLGDHDALPAHLDVLERDVALAARRRVRTLRRRRRSAQALTAALLALGVTAGALAASGVDLGRWLGWSDDAATASFLIDRERTYAGPTPETLRCEARATELRCSETLLAGRRYRLAMTVDRPPSFERDELRRLVGAVRVRGEVDVALLDRIERGLTTVPDEFFVNMQVLAQLGTFSTGLGGDGADVLVPPPGAPLIVVCDGGNGGELACRDLRGARGVPVGAPVLVQERGADWRTVPRPAEARGLRYAAVLEAVWGRPLRPDELQLFLDLGTPAYATVESAGASTVATR